MKRTLLAAVVLLLAASTAFAQFNTTSATTLTLTVAAEASIQADSSTALTTTGTIFNDYTGTTHFTYKVRTGSSVNTAGVTLKITSDFNPSSGPSVANSGTTGDTLTYSCTATASSATACTGTQTSSTGTATSVATFAASAHSVKAGDSGSVAWDLVNDPAYAVGSYNATATFTISAT
jgi:uncharacterized cupredoxin-like copper-binding protein